MTYLCSGVFLLNYAKIVQNVKLPFNKMWKQIDSD